MTSFEEWFEQELRKGNVDDLQSERLVTRNAFHAGQEEMRERAAKKAGYEYPGAGMVIRALPLEGDNDRPD
jgi:hypothetical protein